MPEVRNDLVRERGLGRRQKVAHALDGLLESLHIDCCGGLLGQMVKKGKRAQSSYPCIGVYCWLVPLFLLIRHA